VPLVVTTWNLQGSKGIDDDAVAGHVREQGTDLLLLQEVQRGQAHRIARGLGARSVDWGFKHLNLRTWPEGAALIGVTRPVRARAIAVTRRFQPWSWRRRIIQVARIDDDLMVVNIHLTSRRGAAYDLEREREMKAVAARFDAGRTVLVGGDFNCWPTDPTLDVLTAAGLRDSWPTGAGEILTNWAAGRAHTLAPNRRLDYLFASTAVTASGAHVPRYGDDDFATFGRLSDHLPVTTALDL
jgi:endonuclease/exonuclease/phosphatase family metal-dependent hydrolase